MADYNGLASDADIDKIAGLQNFASGIDESVNGNSYAYLKSDMVLFDENPISTGNFSLRSTSVLSAIRIRKNITIKGFNFITGSTAPTGNIYITLRKYNSGTSSFEVVVSTPNTALGTVSTFANINVLLSQNTIIPAGVYALSITSQDAVGTISGAGANSFIANYGAKFVPTVSFLNSAYFPRYDDTYGTPASLPINSPHINTTGPLIGLVIA